MGPLGGQLGERVVLHGAPDATGRVTLPPMEHTADAPISPSDPVTDSELLIEDELLIEEISIDGMCGVY
jgi:mycofactocin precursor